MSSRGLPGQGPSFVPAYQVSGTPFVTSSLSGTGCSSGGGVASKTRVVKFPYVTRWVQVRNIGTASLRIGFTEHGVNATVSASYYLLGPSTGSMYPGTQSETARWEVRCKELHFRLDDANGGTHFSVMAGLTGIKEFPTLTGSNGFAGVG